MQLGLIVNNSIDLSTDYNDESGYVSPVAQCTSDIHKRDLLDFNGILFSNFEKKSNTDTPKSSTKLVNSLNRFKY